MQNSSLQEPALFEGNCFFTSYGGSYKFLQKIKNKMDSDNSTVPGGALTLQGAQE